MRRKLGDANLHYLDGLELFNADDIGSVRRIYALAGMEFTPEAETAMRRFVADNPRAGGKAIAYDLGPLGLDGAELRERLGFYAERFGPREESRVG